LKSGKIILVDDDRRTLEGLVEKLERATGLKVDSVEAPNLDNLDEIISTKPDLIIVDYLLTMKRSDDTIVNYLGGTLLTRLREETPDIPLVVVSRPPIYGQYPQLRKLSEVADLVFLKNHLENEKYRIGSKLKALIEGYHDITNYDLEKRNWDLLLKLLGATKKEGELLDETNPPIGPDNSIRLDETELLSGNDCNNETFRGWTAHDASRWITGILFSYPGILYNHQYAATNLGVAPESFLSDTTFQDKFKQEQYAGIFKGYEELWWRGRLRSKAASYISHRGTTPIHTIFASQFNEAFDAKLTPSYCNSSEENKEYADTICYILQEPVKTQYSLIYYPDNRPGIMDPARVSFKAIETTNKAKRRLFKKSDQKLFDAIRSGLVGK